MHFSGEEQKGIKGEKLLSFRASAKSGEVLLAPAPKFEEQGLLLSKERRLVQVWGGIAWYGTGRSSSEGKGRRNVAGGKLWLEN